MMEYRDKNYVGTVALEVFFGRTIEKEERNNLSWSSTGSNQAKPQISNALKQQFVIHSGGSITLI